MPKPSSEVEVKDPTHSRLNWLRAGVLGANDGIVSIAALVAGISGASVASHAFLSVVIAGLVGGALSMATGEYVSVNSQRDAEKAMMRRGTHAHDDETQLSNAWHAAGASLVAFLAGGAVPFLSTLVPCDPGMRNAVTFMSVLVALTLTGWLSAWLGSSPRTPAILRNVLGGTVAMVITYAAGVLVSTA